MSEPLDVIGENRKPLSGPRYYDEKANPTGAGLPGVPLRDLSAEEFEALPVWLQYSVDAQPFYRKTKPTQSAPLKAPKEE
jgi:hypothetical protein